MTPEQKHEKEKREKAEEREANLVYFTRIVVALESIAASLEKLADKP